MADSPGAVVDAGIGGGVVTDASGIVADCAGAAASCALQAVSKADNRAMEMEIEMGFGFMVAAP